MYILLASVVPLLEANTISLKSWLFSSNSYTLKEGHVSHLMKMLDKEYGAKMGKAPDKEQQLQGIMNWTLECIRYSDIITIFDIRRFVCIHWKKVDLLLLTM